MSKKLLSCFLALIIVFSIFAALPPTASAYGTPEFTFTDGDLDHVYFAGDTLSFSIGNLLSIEFHTVRISFGLIDFNSGDFASTDIFTSGSLTDGIADGQGYYVERTVSSSSTLSSPVTGTIVSGLDNAAVGFKIFVYDSTHTTWVQYGSTSPTFYFLLADSSGNPVIVGVEEILSYVSDVTFDPVLGSGAQNVENLRDIDVTFGKEIGTGITGAIAFTGLNLVDNSDKLVALDTDITMEQVGTAEAGTLEQYTVGIDVAGTLTFLEGLVAKVTVTSASFNGLTKYDFKAVAASAGTGGAVSNLRFDDTTDTVSFDVNHFSDYTLSLNAPDANSDSYYDPDVAALTAFLDQNSNESGKTNGQVLNEDYASGNPSTFSGCTWSSDTVKRLTRIDWSSGGLAGTLDASEFGKLTTLSINKTALTALDVSDCAALTYLSCSENGLTSLTLTGATNLESVYCNNNELSSLSVNGLTKLTELYLHSNKLTALTLTDLTGLSTLNVSNNLLTDLDASGNANLSALYCYNNNLTGLDISANTVLETLYCYNNKMKLSTLPLPASLTHYEYDAQKAVSVTLQNGGTIDLSAEAVIDSKSTIFKWYKAADDSEITAGITESPTGVFTFDRSVYGGTAVYCTMENDTFPDFAYFDDLLWTAAVTIQAVPVVGGSSNQRSINITDTSGSGTISGTVTEKDNVLTVEIGGSNFRTLADTNKSGVLIDTGKVVVTFDNQAAGFIGETAGTNKIDLSIAQADETSLSSLSEEELALIGNRPVYNFTLTVGGSVITQWNGGHATICVPYVLQPNEEAGAVVVYYIGDSGALEHVTGFYNEETGMVVFTVEHFSLYAVGYNKVTFSDVAGSSWYYDAVTFCAARGITTGIGNGMFAPSESITRAQFLVMLMRAYGIQADANSTDNFTDAGNTYYTQYLATAKRLGIANGIGDNRFAPEAIISRQDLFTLLYRALKSVGELPIAAAGKSTADFDDANQISSYAKSAVETLVTAGIINGMGGKLDPCGTSTRAQMAQVLYKLLFT